LKLFVRHITALQITGVVKESKVGYKYMYYYISELQLVSKC